MNDNQRVGFVYRIIEDQQKEKPLSKLDLKNLAHYAETGEFLDEEIAKFEEFQKDTQLLAELHEKAEKARAILEKPSVKKGLENYNIFINGEERSGFERELTYLDRLAEDLGKISRMQDKAEEIIKQNTDCFETIGGLLNALTKLKRSDLSQNILFETEDGKLWSCKFSRVGSKICIKRKARVILKNAEESEL